MSRGSHEREREELKCVCPKLLSSVQLFVMPWTVARQHLPSMGFSRQQYWSGLPCPPPGDLPDPGMEPKSLTSPALAGRFFTTSVTWEVLYTYVVTHKGLE